MKKVKKMGMGGMPGTPVVDKTQSQLNALTVSPTRSNIPLRGGSPDRGFRDFQRDVQRSVKSQFRDQMRGARDQMKQQMHDIRRNPSKVFSFQGGLGSAPPMGSSGPLQTLSSVLGNQTATPMKKGGKVSSASARADGCAIRGKTKGRMI